MYCRRSAFLIDRIIWDLKMCICSIFHQMRNLMSCHVGLLRWPELDMRVGSGSTPWEPLGGGLGADLWLFTEFGSSLFSTSLDPLFFSSLCHLLQFFDMFLALFSTSFAPVECNIPVSFSHLCWWFFWSSLSSPAYSIES